jgi:hypothetical protein
MVVVFGFDQGDRDIRLVVKNLVGALGLAAGKQFTPHDNPALGKANLLANL